MFVTKDHVRADEVQEKDIILIDGQFCIVLYTKVLETAPRTLFKLAHIGYAQLSDFNHSCDSNLFVMRYQWED